MKHSIRFLFIASLFSISFTFSSCEKLKDKLIPAFVAQSTDIDIYIPASAAGQQYATGTVHYNVDSVINANVTGKNSTNLGSAKIKTITMDIVNADVNNNFANFSDGGIMMNTNTYTTPIVVGNITNNPDAYSASLNIPISGTDIKPYLTGKEFAYLYGYLVRRATTKTLHAVLHVTFELKL